MTWSRALGDTLLLIPALRALRSGCVEAKLHLIGAPGPAQALLAAGEIDSWADNGDSRLSVLAAGVEGGREQTREAREARLASLRPSLLRPDLLVAFASRGELIASTADALGIDHLTARPLPPAGRHAAEHLVDSLASIGIARQWRGPGGVAPIDVAGAREARATGPATARGRAEGPVLLHPGSGAAWKCAPPRLFAEVAQRLTTAGLAVDVVEGPADAAYVAAMEWTGTVIRPITTVQLASSLLAASTYVGGDSGVTHLAGLLGIPTVALFGPTHPDTWGPLGPSVTVLRACAEPPGEDVRICHDPGCLDMLSIRHVVAAAVRHPAFEP